MLANCLGNQKISKPVDQVHSIFAHMGLSLCDFILMDKIPKTTMLEQKMKSCKGKWRKLYQGPTPTVQRNKPFTVVV